MSESIRRRQRSQQSQRSDFEFLHALPLNATGKVMKDQLT